jgi:signal transduction histidine kinase
MKREEAETMLRVSLESEKNERTRIAADLHDGVSGDLSAIKNYLGILSKKETSSSNIEMFDDVKASIDNALQNTRAVSHNLMPPLLETEGLVPALKSYLDGISKAGITFTIKASNIALPSSTAYQIFRVLQEFTTNMVKYGNVTNVEIEFVPEKDFLKIGIVDDGISFNFKENLAKPNASGLKNINSRLHAVGGVIIQQEIEKGNYFTITLKNIKDA